MNVAGRNTMGLFGAIGVLILLAYGLIVGAGFSVDAIFYAPRRMAHNRAYNQVIQLIDTNHNGPEKDDAPRPKGRGIVT